jgi:hypothetical protein
VVVVLLLRHLDHQHVDGRGHDEIQKRNLHAPDGIDREGRRIHARGHDVLVKIQLDRVDADRQRKGNRIGELLFPERPVQPQLAPVLAPQGDEHESQTDGGEHGRANEHSAQASDEKRGKNEEQRPSDVGDRVGDGGSAVPLARDHHDLEHGRHQHERQKQPEQHHLLGQRRVAERRGNARAHGDEGRHAHASRQRKRHERVGDVARRPIRSPRNEVVETLGHAELGEAEERRVHEEELLVGAEFRRREHPREDDADGKRGGHADRATDDEQQRRPRNLVGVSGGAHTW